MAPTRRRQNRALHNEVYDAVTTTFPGLTGRDFERPTQQLLDAQRALVALATPSERQPDVRGDVLARLPPVGR